VKLSINVTNYSWPGSPTQLAGRLAELARLADAAGLDTVWVPDHLLQVDPNAGIDEPMLEAYATLGYLASATTGVSLGTMVTSVAMRPPALIVKAVTTIDVLSGGRAWLGVGTGYNAEEASRCALPFPSTPERYDRLEELLQLADHLWNGTNDPFEGSFHSIDAPLASPMPVKRPRVLIGGMGERRTLPLVARYADACNLFDIPDGGRTLRHKLNVVAAACERIGRDPAEIEVTLSSRVGEGETADELTERCAGLRALGIDHLVLVSGHPWQPGPELDTVLEAADAVRRLA